MFKMIGKLLSPITRPLGRVLGPPWKRLRARMAQTPVLAFQLGLLVAVLLEKWQGEIFADTLGFRRIPRFFGIVDIFEPFSKLDFSGILGPFFPPPTSISATPVQDSGNAIGELVTTFVNALFYQGPREPGFFDVIFRVAIYDLVVFVVPIILLAVLLRPVVREILTRLPHWSLIVLHLVIMFVVIMLWGDDGGTRELVLIFMGINVILAVSLNLVNGYMGEFSVGHAAFMAVGAYVSSVITMWAFTDDRVFGPAVLDPSWGLPVGFAVALLAGGVAAAIAGLFVAFPSFRTRGDYLAIVTLAVNFIVQSAINNMEGIGGARGLNGVPLWSDLSWVLVITILSVIVIYSLVNSTFGKGIVAIREDEIAASLMGVNTKQIKLVAFLVSSFFAGVAGGLFAHVLAYINPGNFGILKSTEVLVMVYLGGMGSISGSVIAAIIFTLLLEALRPLAILKWVVIPLILITLMLFRPQGLYGFREIELNWGWSKKQKDLELNDAAAGD